MGVGLKNSGDGVALFTDERQQGVSCGGGDGVCAFVVVEHRVNDDGRLGV